MNRLKELRDEKKVSMAQIARDLNVPYTTYVNYEKEEREPNSEMLIKLANYFNVSIDYIIGRSSVRKDSDNTSSISGIIPFPKMKKVPLLGTIACGEPILAQENIDSYINMPEDVGCSFALRCKGDSMINARIFDGDIVYIREQPDVENGEIAAVLIDNEATLKKVYKYPNRIELRPENPTMKPLEYEGEEMNNVRIIGKAVYFLSPVQ